VIRAQGLEKRYGRKRVLRGIDLEVGRDGLLLVTGPNGSGKTTLLRLCAGLALPTGGTLEVDADRAQLGFLGHEPLVYRDLSAMENLDLYGRLYRVPERRERVGMLLERFGLWEVRGERVASYSRGMTQRLALCRVLLHEPELLVLDEPFSGLDPIGTATMTEVLQDRARNGVGVVFSSHQLDLVEDVCEDVVIIARGRVVAAGAIDELKARSGRRHLEIEVVGSDATWLDGDATLSILERDGDRVKLLVRDDVDLDELLGRARAAGEVRTFAYQPPRLSELFMEAVTPTPDPRSDVVGREPVEVAS
jgi:ABC-2 type transport system ATP-binding protein